MIWGREAMKHNVTMYDLLLSCPGDAYRECYPAVKKAIERFNADPQINNSVIISLKHWSTDSYPQSGGQAQKLLNLQIVNDADIAIAIFWTRFGTPTDDYGSGTEEEIDLLLKNKKQVFLYFLDKPVPPSITDSPEYIENRRKITLLREKYDGIYTIAKDEDDLARKIVDHLKLFFSQSNTKVEDSSNRWYRTDTGEEVLPTELLKFGNTSAQLDGTVARVEVSRPDGKTIYAEVDTTGNSVSRIVTEGYPQEYVIDIPQDLIIEKKYGTTIIEGKVYRAEIYVLKFNGHIHAIFDIQNNKLQDINVQAPAGMTAIVDIDNKKIRIAKKDDG